MFDSSVLLNELGSPSMSYAGVAGTADDPHVMPASPSKSRKSVAVALGRLLSTGMALNGDAPTTSDEVVVPPVVVVRPTVLVRDWRDPKARPCASPTLATEITADVTADEPL